MKGAIIPFLKVSDALSKFFIIPLLVLSACATPDNQQQTVEESLIVFDRENLEPCIKKELYYDTRIDMDSYQSLGTQYFHGIEDYTSKNAHKLERDLLKRRRYLDQKLRLVGDDELLEVVDSLQQEERELIVAEMDSIKQELAPYRKEVVGYVFIHTFLSAGDTHSVIFLMDTRCVHTEAISVRTIPQELDPEKYKEIFRDS